MKYTTYLFDFDGTLVDSMPTYASLMLRILDENSISYGDDIVKIITPLGYHGTAVVFEIIEGDEIATIDAKGKITAKAEGTVVVRISAEAGTEEAYEDVEIRICNLATKVTLNMTKATIAVDDELQLEAIMTAKGECTDTLTWSVDKPDIATVDENGLVTAHSAGKVKVTAKSGSGKSASCTITVTK